ncbi:MAG: hypothetical protein NUV61_00675 [Candidatus Azambacteria bacterium]|nr:hypothetical protein [Candidatus Azambacteria bacterium]
MQTGDKDVKLTSRYLSKAVEDVLHKIKGRSEKIQKCRLRVAGTPYLGTSCVEKEHKSSLPRKEREKAKIISIRPGIWRGEPWWIIRCDVFNRDILHIVEEELSGLVERVGNISFFISVH